MSEVYTVNTLADHWACSPDVIYDLLRSQKLKGFKLGSSWRISQTAVSEYEEAPVPTKERVPVRNKLKIV